MNATFFSGYRSRLSSSPCGRSTRRTSKALSLMDFLQWRLAIALVLMFLTAAVSAQLSTAGNVLSERATFALSNAIAPSLVLRQLPVSQPISNFFRSCPECEHLNRQAEAAKRRVSDLGIQLTHLLNDYLDVAGEIKKQKAKASELESPKDGAKFDYPKLRPELDVLNRLEAELMAIVEDYWVVHQQWEIERAELHLLLLDLAECQLLCWTARSGLASHFLADGPLFDSVLDLLASRDKERIFNADINDDGDVDEVILGLNGEVTARVSFMGVLGPAQILTNTIGAAEMTLMDSDENGFVDVTIRDSATGFVSVFEDNGRGFLEVISNETDAEGERHLGSDDPRDSLNRDSASTSVVKSLSEVGLRDQSLQRTEALQYSVEFEKP